MVKCHDCGVEEGELHKEGCDMETCPKCGGQLISCDCRTEDLPDYRIPWVQIPVLCALCGKQFPEDFKVSNKEWQKFVIPELQSETLCWSCFCRLKKLFPLGWKRSNAEQSKP